MGRRVATIVVLASLLGGCSARPQPTSAAPTSAAPTSAAPTSAAPSAAINEPPVAPALDWPFCPLEKRAVASPPFEARGHCSIVPTTFEPCRGERAATAILKSCCEILANHQDAHRLRCTGQLELAASGPPLRIELPVSTLEAVGDVGNAHQAHELEVARLGSGVQALLVRTYQRSLEYAGSGRTDLTLYAFDGAQATVLVRREMEQFMGMQSNEAKVSFEERAGQIADLIIDQFSVQEEGYDQYRYRLRFEHGQYHEIEGKYVDRGSR
jgi:hypothetical protein